MGNSTKIAFPPTIKRLLFVIAVFSSLSGIRLIIGSFEAPQLYRKDFISGYLIAKAVLNGINPYTPLPMLAERWVSGARLVQLNHPTPHPPGLGLFCLPLGLLNYEISALLWLFFELACILVSVCLILRWWELQLKPGVVLATFLCSLGWVPITDDLLLGQFNSCLLLLLLLAWFALRDGKNVAGGAFLGVMIALKLAAWPIVLFLALRRSWKGVLAAAAVVFTVHLAAIMVMSLAVVRDYYLKIGPMVSIIYRGYANNFSIWTLGERLFSENRIDFITMPLWPSPLLAHLITYLAPIGFLIFGLTLALKAKRFDTSFGIMVIVGILVSPIAWDHYLVLAVIPIIIAMRRIVVMETSRRMTYAMFVTCIFISISSPPSSRVAAALLFSAKTASNGIPIVPLWAGVLTLLPAIAALGIIIILWKTDRISLPRASQIEGSDEREELRAFAATEVV